LPAKEHRAGIVIAVIGAVSAIIVAYIQIGTRSQEAVEVKASHYAGRVIDTRTQKPVAGAKVSLELSKSPAPVYTDSEGVYEFELMDPPPRIIRVRVDASGYKVYIRRISFRSQTDLEDIRLEASDEKTNNGSESHASANAPALALAKIELLQSSSYYRLTGARHIFIEREDSSSNHLIVEVGLSNPSDQVVYITKISMKVAYSSLDKIKLDEARVIVPSVTVTFREATSNADIQDFARANQLTEKERFENIVVFGTPQNFTLATIAKIRSYDYVEEVESTVAGTGYSDILPSGTISFSDPLNPMTRDVYAEANKKISARDVDYFPISLKFALPGTYTLSGEIIYANGRMLLPPLTVRVHSNPLPPLGPAFLVSVLPNREAATSAKGK
jgi:hypothetical protein